MVILKLLDELVDEDYCYNVVSFTVVQDCVPHAVHAILIVAATECVAFHSSSHACFSAFSALYTTKCRM